MKVSYPTFLKVLLSVICLLLPLCSPSIMPTNPQTNPEGQLKSTLPQQVQKSSAISTINSIEFSAFYATNQQILKKQSVVQNQVELEVKNEKHNQQNNRLITDKKNKGFEIEESSVLGVGLVPINRIGFWSSQTIQNTRTANLFDRLISSIASRNYATSTSTTSSATTTIITSSSTETTTTTVTSNNSEIVAPLPENKTFDLDFTVMQQAPITKNEPFKFQRSFTLPQVAPIKLTYEEYLTDYKPALFKAPFQQRVFRQSIYKLNLQLINVNNALVLRQFNMGLNLFTDVQLNQFYKKYNKLVIPEDLVKEGLIEQARLKNQNGTFVFTKPPRIIIDWTCLASSVISQGACGASYIIAPLQTIAITMKMYNSSVIYLSIQQVLSCGYEKNGCTSGYFSTTYNYVQIFGVGQSSFYFYDDKAKFNSQVSQCNRTVIGNKLYMKNKVYIQQYRRIRFGDCEEVVKQLRFKALSVAITGNGLQFYSEGTFDAISTNINHGVTLVGYHPDQGYLIKNSWGRTWGMLGYGYVSESTGVCSFAMYPVVKNQLGTPLLCSPQV